MDISVIIVNWNTIELLRVCLSSIYKFTKDLNFEVIVVDNNSSDGSQQMVKTGYPQVNTINNKENLGFSQANNQGIKIAKGKYCLLLNSDTYLIENALKEIVVEAENTKNLGALGPLLLNEDKSIQQSVGFFPHLPQVFFWMTFIDDLPFGTFLRPYHVDHDIFYKKQQKVDWITGAAFLVPSKIIKSVGYLDENIFMYGEDVEWCYRIKKAGFKVIFTPRSRIVHIGGGSNRKIQTPAFVGEYRGLTYFYKKYKPDFTLQILRFLLKIGALTRIVVFTSLGRMELVKSYAEVLKMA